jgi:hypothetical protein
MEYHQHLSDLRTVLLLRGASTSTGDEVLRKAERCARALTEARRMMAACDRSTHFAQLLDCAHELLDDLDVALLALSHDRDRAVFNHLSDLREALGGLEAWRRNVDALRREERSLR